MPFQYAPFSEKQLDVILDNLEARITILEGSVSSGKTISSIIRWALYVFKETSDHAKLLMIGVTADTLKRNVIDDLIDIVGDAHAKYKDGELKLFGRTIYCVGARDEGQEKRIRGLSVEGCYIDEVTQIPINVIKQAIIRCRKGRGRMIWTTNPDSPYHPVYTDYVGNEKAIAEGRIKVYHFEVDDNLALSEEYKRDLKESFTGLWFKRMILGLWVIAEGIIYDKFDPDVHGIRTKKLPKKFDTISLTVDYGTQNPFAAILMGQIGEESIALAELYYSGRDNMATKTDAEYSADIDAWLEELGYSKNKDVERVFLDPSAANFKAQLRKDGWEEIVDVDNDVLNGIKTVADRIAKGLFKVVKERCPNVVREFLSYIWDDRASMRGEDKPLKKHDHTLDAIRYHEYTVYGGPEHVKRVPIVHGVGDNSIDISRFIGAAGGR